MILPGLNETNKSALQINAFGGYNCTNFTAETEFYDMENMTSNALPAIANRPLRGNLAKTGYSTVVNNGSAIDYSKFKLFSLRDSYYVYGMDGSVYLGGMPLPSFSSSGIKDVVTTNTHIIGIGNTWKDYNRNTNRTTDMNVMVGNTTGIDWNMFVMPVVMSGNEIEIPFNCSPNFLASITYDTEGNITNIPTAYGSEKSPYLNATPSGTLNNCYSDSSGAYTVGVSSSYCGICFRQTGYSGDPTACPTIDLSNTFKKNEVVTIRNCKESDMNGTFTVWGFKDEWMIITRIGKALRETGNCYIERFIPNMDVVVECGNRLWGGTSDGREIYASVIGQPGLWQVFAGESTDSVALTVGTDGKFTGACVINNRPVFFKENWVHTVTGTLPSNYTVSKVETRGVKRGCSKSLKVIDDVAFYVGEKGVYISNGGASTQIGQPLGEGVNNVISAVGGKLNSKYYVSIKKADGSKLYVYDTENGLWHVEDNLDVVSMAETSNDLFISTTDGLYSVCQTTFAPFTSVTEKDISWFVESGNIGYSSDNAKYISRINLRLLLDTISSVGIKMMYDSSGKWETVGTFTGKGRVAPFTVPIIPRRCDHFKYRIEGVGEGTLLSLTKILEEGSNVWL